MDKKYFSQNDLDFLLKKEMRTRGLRGVDTVLEEIRNENPTEDKRTIFLSHSHEDKTLVKRISVLFNKIGTGVYIDWMDESLPVHTNSKTARAIKEKIRNCHRFLFLATYKGLQSKWCSWELGIAHSLKEEQALAVLPIETRSGNWPKNEYLQLYPEMSIDTSDMDNLSASNVSIKIGEQQRPLL